MSTSFRRPREAVLAKHRREMRLQVYLPLIITGLLLIVVPLILVIASSPYQVGTVAAFMSLLLLIPAVLVCLIPYVTLIALAALTFKLNRWLPTRFITVRSIVHTVNLRTDQLARQAASPIIWISQRIAWLEQFVSSRGKSSKTLPMLPGSVSRNEQ